MNDYNITVNLKFKSNKSLEETRKFLIDVLIGYDVEIQNILSNDDIYYNREFEIED
jgi:hypothetical protein